jgi:hypothetical protein
MQPLMGSPPPGEEIKAKLYAAEKRAEELMKHESVSPDSLWPFEIMNTQRRVNDLLGVVVTLMTHDYTWEAQPIAHEVARLTLRLEEAIKDRNQQNAKRDPGSSEK